MPSIFSWLLAIIILLLLLFFTAHESLTSVIDRLDADEVKYYVFPLPKPLAFLG